jgi:hypothetical protein
MTYLPAKLVGSTWIGDNIWLRVVPSPVTVQMRIVFTEIQ